MLFEARLVITAKEARLLLKRDDAVEEDEVWKFERRLTKAEAEGMVRVVFDDCYDMMNYAAHGDS